MARKAHYTARIANDICEYVAMGATLEEALKKVGYLAPSLPTCWRWLSEHEEFRVKYEQARQLQAHTLADKTLWIVEKLVDKDGKAKDTSAYRLAYDIMRWHSEIRDPKTYNRAANLENKTLPLDAKKVREEIKRLEKELGVIEKGQQDKSGTVVSLKSMNLKKAGE